MIGGNRFKPGVLSAGMSLQELTLTAEDAQLVATRQFQVEDVARIYGVPPFMIGHTANTSSWGTGVESMGIGFVKYTLQRHLVKIEQELNRKLLGIPGILLRVPDCRAGAWRYQGPLRCVPGRPGPRRRARIPDGERESVAVKTCRRLKAAMYRSRGLVMHQLLHLMALNRRASGRRFEAVRNDDSGGMRSRFTCTT